MYFYQLYGLSVQSDLSLSLPELPILEKSVDLKILSAKIDIPTDIIFEQSFDNIKIVKTLDSTYLFWKNTILCKIIQGKEIVINDLARMEKNFLKSLILGPVFAILLHQRGCLVLHANAVNMNGNAIILLGSMGKGKSTTSLALHKSGYKIMSDDIVSIQFSNSVPMVFPGSPTMKLSSEVVDNLLTNHKSLPKVYSNPSKRVYNFSESFLENPIPLKVIYLIEDGTETSIGEIKPKEEIISMIKSTYSLGLFDKNELAENLKQCSEILNEVPLKLLNIKRSFRHINEVVKVIEFDLE